MRRRTLILLPMLHHAVWTSQWRRDATCGSSWLGLAGERLFAGRRRANGDHPALRLRPQGRLVRLVEHARGPDERLGDEQTAYVEVTFTTRPSSESVQAVRPVWLDIDQCGDSEYRIPTGPSDTHRDRSVNVPGKVVGAIGHVHGHGVAVQATDESRGGASICRSEATLGANPHRVLAMETCTGDPLARLRSGDVVRLHSEYNSSTHAADDVMGTC